MISFKVVYPLGIGIMSSQGKFIQTVDDSLQDGMEVTGCVVTVITKVH